VLLLDTHTWVWAVEGDTRRIGRQARRWLARAEADGAVLVSSVTVFEVAALYAAGRLQLRRGLEPWIREALETAGVRVAELTVAMAIDAGNIPRTALADPLDRLIVATARQLDGTLMTSDAAILRYAGNTGRVRVRRAGA
jgi:PIN domain nuclease of toxin-antitoxin system